MKMTALEMAQKYNWADVTVHFNPTGNDYFGHVSAEGKTRIVSGNDVSVWVGDVCLRHNVVVTVKQEIGSNGVEVAVYWADNQIAWSGRRACRGEMAA